MTKRNGIVKMLTPMVCDSFTSFALYLPFASIIFFPFISNPLTSADPLRSQLKTTPPTITQMKKRHPMTTSLTLMIQRARMAGLGTCLATAGM
jgi:hypothetical protein